MNWEAIGALGELAGAIAVVASLIYVGFQLKQNTSAIRGERYSSINSQLVNVYTDWAGNDKIPELINLFAAERATLSSFSPDDVVRIRLMFTAAARIIEDVYRQVSEGNLPESALEHLGTAHWFMLPIAEEIWPTMNMNFSDDFRSYIETRYQNLDRDGGT